jgi:hypothetical protein
VIQVDWICRVEIVHVEPVVASFLIALEIAMSGLFRAPANMPLSLHVLMDEGGGGNHKVRRGVRPIIA